MTEDEAIGMVAKKTAEQRKKLGVLLSKARQYQDQIEAVRNVFEEMVGMSDGDLDWINVTKEDWPSYDDITETCSAIKETKTKLSDLEKELKNFRVID